ncbi:MAG: S49 family peptidase [Fibrobacter sp.]|nr:S49 family peptidase [Fibrobacter sp.]
MAKSKNKSEKMMKAFLATRFAMRRDEAEKFASVNFDWEWKENGEPFCPNCMDIRDDGVAVIHVDGPLSYRTDLFTAWAGMDTYNSIESAFDDALNNRKVKSIVFDINSPGGEVNGCADLAEKIFNARRSNGGPKPIVARTGGMMCSAAYWIGSACEKVYTASNGTLGSIGVLCAYNKNEDDVNVIVSDLSPDKAPTPETEEGLSLIKNELNDLAEVFINAVAVNRGTTAIDVKSNFGKGGVFIGQKAVDAHLADGVVSLEEICDALATGMDPIELSNNKKRKCSMAENKNAEISAEEIAKNAIASYKQSISDVKALFDACHINEDATAFVDGCKTLADAKEYAFVKMQENVCAMEKANAETVAAKDAQIAQLKAELDAAKASEPSAALSEAQKLAIQKGLEAEASAANSVEGGAMSSDGFKKMMKAAFSKGAESFKAK